MRRIGYAAAVYALLVAALAGTVRAQDAVTPGELVVEPPTLICLGFEWRVKGDENNDASVAVCFRRKGADEWRRGLPLDPIEYKTRLGEDGSELEEPRVVKGFAGSILDLEPDSAYQVRLEMHDPDGVQGEGVRELTLSTRAEPQPYPDGEVRHVYPPNYKGLKQEPAYRSIMHAVNGYHPWCDCYRTVHPDAAPPGTVIKLHAGTYKIDRFNYREPTQRWLHGTITLVADGTPDKPIAIVAAGDGEVVIDGDGCHNLFNIRAADYLYFEGLTIRNTFIAFHGGFQGVMGCKGLTVKDCWIENVAYGVLAQDGRSEGFYIADNVFIGKNPHDRFNPESGGAWGRTKAGYAVNLSGKGHVVCHNYAADFWDVMNVFTSALADPFYGQQARAIDFYNNDLYNGTDNFIESDGTFANTRILRNRCFNCLAAPLSVQPVYQGPVYWVRNVVFNAAGGGTGFKLVGRQNVHCYHNTLTCFPTMDFVSREVMLNNAFAGPVRTPDSRRKHIFRYSGRDGGIRDHNAYRVAHPLEGLFVVGSGDNANSHASLSALCRATGLEEHGLTFGDYSVFAGAEEPTHARSNQDPLVDPATVDLRPAAGSPLIDAGTVIPNVNEDYAGDAPDIGAYERGRPIPRYGPRKGPYLDRLEALREGRYRPGTEAGGRNPVPDEATASIGRPVTGVTDEDGVIEAIRVGETTLKIGDLVFGTPRTEADVRDVGEMCNFDMTTGMPSHGTDTLVVDVTDFGGANWKDTNGEGPDFFIFEAGANDNVLVAPILAGDVVGKAAAIRGSAWGDTGIATPIGAGNSVGVAIEVTELFDEDGEALSRDAGLKGLRIISQPTGMDLACVCAVKPES